MWEKIAAGLEPFHPHLPTVALAALGAAILGSVRSWRSSERLGENFGCLLRLRAMLIAAFSAALGATFVAGLAVEWTTAHWWVATGAALLGALGDVTRANGIESMVEQAARLTKRVSDIWHPPDNQRRQ